MSALETYNILKAARDARGLTLNIVVLPSPAYDRIRARSKDFVSSYIKY